MSDIYGWIVGALGLLASFVGIYIKGRNDSKKLQDQKNLEQSLAAERKRNEERNVADEIIKQNDSISDSDVRKRLSDNWTKDN